MKAGNAFSGSGKKVRVWDLGAHNKAHSHFRKHCDGREPHLNKAPKALTLCGYEDGSPAAKSLAPRSALTRAMAESLCASAGCLEMCKIPTPSLSTFTAWTGINNAICRASSKLFPLCVLH